MTELCSYVYEIVTKEYMYNHGFDACLPLFFLIFSKLLPLNEHLSLLIMLNIRKYFFSVFYSSNFGYKLISCKFQKSKFFLNVNFEREKNRYQLVFLFQIISYNSFLIRLINYDLIRISFALCIRN